MLHAPRRLTCLDHPLLSIPAALCAHRKGSRSTLIVRATSVLGGNFFSLVGFVPSYSWKHLAGQWCLFHTLELDVTNVVMGL